MQKKLIALAVAGALATPFAAAADSANVTIYGKMHASWDFVDTNHATNDASDDATGVFRATRLGFKGSEDLGNGMKAVFQLESQYNPSLGGGAMSMRNSFVGLAGDWGTVVMGSHDTPYKISTGSLDLFGDTIGDYNNIIGTVVTSTAGATSTRFDERVPQTVAYISPTFNGFTAAIARVSAVVQEASGADETDAWSMMALYSNGPLFGALAYQRISDGAGAFGGSNIGAYGGNTSRSESDAWKLGLGYTFGDSKVGFVYENIDNDASAADLGRTMDRDAWMINFAHNFGNNTVKVQYAEADDANCTGCANTGADNWSIGLDHAFSKRTTAYVMYSTVDNDSGVRYNLNRGSDVGAGGATVGRDVDAFSVGLTHSF